MKVFAWVKNKAGLAHEQGDVIYFYPMVEDQGKDTLNHFYPLVVDITIPCGETFAKVKHDCPRCKWNDPDSCDVIKYTRGKWSTGDVLNPPKIIEKREYKVDISKIIDSTILKEEKTTIEKEAIITDTKKTENTTSIFVKKETVDEKSVAK